MPLSVCAVALLLTTPLSSLKWIVARAVLPTQVLQQGTEHRGGCGQVHPAEVRKPQRLARRRIARDLSGGERPGNAEHSGRNARHGGWSRPPPAASTEGGDIYLTRKALRLHHFRHVLNSRLMKRVSSPSAPGKSLSQR